jgi:hypothetical protein
MVNSILQPVEQQPCSALALRGIGTSVPGEHDEHKALSVLGQARSASIGASSTVASDTERWTPLRNCSKTKTMRSSLTISKNCDRYSTCSGGRRPRRCRA